MVFDLFSSSPPPPPEPSASELSSPVATERMRAVAALGSRGRPSRIAFLVETARYDGDVDVVFEATAALAQIGSARAIEDLLGIALDGGLPVARRIAATTALGTAPVASRLATLAIERLGAEGEPWVRSTARELLQGR
jgi:HEAT repeat protein